MSIRKKYINFFQFIALTSCSFIYFLQKKCKKFKHPGLCFFLYLDKRKIFSAIMYIRYKDQVNVNGGVLNGVLVQQMLSDAKKQIIV